MKLILNYILPLWVIFYFIFSFVKLEINFALWTENIRCMYIVVCCFFSLLSTAIYNISKNE